jgi:hypothetical protein
MAIDENHISLRPGGGRKHPIKTGSIPSFHSAPLQPSNRPYAPFNSSHQPSAPLQSSNRPLKSSHHPSVSLQSSHRPTVSLQSSHQLSEPLKSSSQALSKNSQPIIAGVDLQAQV